MPLLPTWYAVCDTCTACDGAIHELHTDRQNKASTAARKAGWHRTHTGRWVCPVCWDQGAR